MTALKPCGTTAAYRRHSRHGERPCEACADAWRAYQREVSLKGECGTPTGYLAHRARGEKSCDECAAVRRARWQENNRKRRAPSEHRPVADLPRWESAACAGMDTEMFFPDPTDLAGIAAAQSVCSGCPVRVACAAFATAHPDIEGVWGGTTGDDRRRLRVAS